MIEVGEEATQAGEVAQVEIAREMGDPGLPEGDPVGGREDIVRPVVSVECQANLPEIDAALGTTGRLAGLLDRRQGQGGQQARDSDDDQQLDEGERGLPIIPFGGPHRVLISRRR